MAAAEQFTDTIDELLTPIEHAVSECARGKGDAQSAASACRRAADVFGDIGAEDAASVARIFGLLFEVAEQAAQVDDDAAQQASRDVHEFISTGLPSLRASLTSESDESSAAIAHLLDQASDQWGEHIRLLSDDLSDDAEIPVADSEQESEVAGDRDDQVGLILSALDSPSTTPDPSPQAVDRPSADSRRSESTGTRPTAPPVFPASTPVMDPELLEAYLEDAGQCLASMERAVLDFENAPASAAPIELLCRELHTLKGASASVGLQELATQIHAVEDAIEEADGATDSVPLNLVMECVDAVRTQIASLQRRSASPKSAVPAVAETLPQQPAVSAMPTDADGGDTLRVRTAQLDRLMDLLADVVMWRSRREERLIEFDSVDDELSRCLFRLQALDHRGPAAGSQADMADSAGRKYLAELVSDLREITLTVRESRQALADENRAITQFIQQFRQELVQIRRVPLTGLFQRLHRAIREAARIECKQVRLEIHGEHVGLERSMQEKLYEPLLHLVRNSVSHGIESPKQRTQAGKSPTGTVTLEAYGSPHVLVLEVRDDGAGLDYDAIRRRGLERGLILPDRPVSEAELARLIFRPGFSTRTESNEVSGRGVGMNVVESVLQSCQCHIETESNPGTGTTFRLTIPLRSVIEHTLLFRCGGQTFGLPMQFVKEASHGNRSDHRPHTASVRRNLAHVLGLAAEKAQDNAHWIEIADRLAAPASDQSSGRMTREYELNLIVDEVLGPEEVVVRPLPAMLRNHPHLCGMTLSGAGDVVFLLDGRRLLLDAANSPPSEEPCPAEPETPNEDRQDSETHVLVIDDSLSARRALIKKLRRYGFGITEAADGEQGIELLREQPFDAVFSDLEMPHLSGFDMLAEMAALTPSAPPCVIVTTRSEADTQSRAAALGAAGFLAKPVDDKALDDMLERLDLMPLASQSEMQHS